MKIQKNYDEDINDADIDDEDIDDEDIDDEESADEDIDNEDNKTSQELRMLSSVTLNCQVAKVVMNSGSQLSEL